MKRTLTETGLSPGHHVFQTPRIAGLIQLMQQYVVPIMIVIGILIRLPLVGRPLTYSVTDTWRQADTASIAHNFLNTHNLFYPQINWGGNGPGYVEAEFQLYPFIVSWLYLFFGEHVWIGRFVSLLFATAAYTLFYRLSRYLLSRTAALWALAFLIVSPLAIRYSVAFMPEATELFFYVGALYWFRRWMDKEQLAYLWLAAISTTLAILVKPTSIHIGLIFILMLIQKERFRFLKRWELWAFALISLVPGALWFIHARNLYLDYGNTFGIISGGDSKFGDLRYWLAPGFYRLLLQLDNHWIFGVGGLVLFGIGFVLSLRHRGRLMMIVFGTAIIFVYYLVLARYSSVDWGIQYHIYFLPFAALGAGLGLEWLFQKAASGKPIFSRIASNPYVLAGVVSILLILAWTLRVYRNELLVPTEQDVAMCARFVSQNVPEDKLIIASSMQPASDNGVPNNFQEPYIFFFGHRYGWSLAADRHTVQQVQAFRQKGASYFVIYSDALYQANPDLAAYLQGNAQQIGPGVQAGCGIYQFNSS